MLIIFEQVTEQELNDFSHKSRSNIYKKPVRRMKRRSLNLNPRYLFMNVMIDYFSFRRYQLFI